MSDAGERAPRYAGICLAAGGASRFGSDKLAAPFRGKPLLQWAVGPLLDCGRLADVLVFVLSKMQHQAHYMLPQLVIMLPMH